jgi:hypothetical protein
VGSVGVVVVDPGAHGLCPVGGRGVGHGVDPFTQRGLDEALGLAVGARRVGPGPDVLQAGLGEEIAEGMAAVGRAVVAHHALDGDAMSGEERQRLTHEGDGALLGLVGQNGRVGEARGIVDGHMQGLPADAAPAVAPVAGDAVTDAVDPTELLRVDVDEFARPLALIADDRRPNFERAQPAETETAQDPADGGAWKREAFGDGLTRQPRAPQSLDLHADRGRDTHRWPEGGRASVAKDPTPPVRKRASHL